MSLLFPMSGLPFLGFIFILVPVYFGIFRAVPRRPGFACEPVPLGRNTST